MSMIDPTRSGRPLVELPKMKAVSPLVVRDGGAPSLPDLPPEIPGWLKGAADKLVKVGGDINKLPFWEKALITIAGFIVGWKLDEYVHYWLEKQQGQKADRAQDLYLDLKRDTNKLLAYVGGDEKGFWEKAKGWFTDPTGSEWKAFCLHVVNGEMVNFTPGDYQGEFTGGKVEPIQPVVLIKLASNPDAPKEAIEQLVRGIRMRPGLAGNFKIVMQAIEKYHPDALK